MPHLWEICLLGVYRELWDPNTCGKIPPSLSCAPGTVGISYNEEDGCSRLSQALFFPLRFSIPLFVWIGWNRIKIPGLSAIPWIECIACVVGTPISVLSSSWHKVYRQPRSLSRGLDYSRKARNTIGLNLLDRQTASLHTGQIHVGKPFLCPPVDVCQTVCQILLCYERLPIAAHAPPLEAMKPDLQMSSLWSN
jgi:hypothetical protein